MNGSPREFLSRGRYLKSEGQRMGHRLRLLVDDRFVGNGILIEAHRALDVLPGVMLAWCAERR